VKRRRGLTAEDKAIWAAVARTIRPLPGREMPEAPPLVTIEPPPRAEPTPPPVPKPRLPPPEINVGAQPSGLDAKRWRDLRRGTTRPQRQLDLHGMTAAMAHRSVEGFIRMCHAEGARVVCIVTGKGSSPEGGVLKRELPHWLNAPGLRPLILGAAHPHRANAGSVHLLLRRTR